MSSKIYAGLLSRSTLDDVPKDKQKLLTVKFDLIKLAEFYAASDMHRARTISEFVHQYANRMIEKARQTDPVRFAELVEEKKKEIQVRAAQKAQERRAGAESPKGRKPHKLPMTTDANTEGDDKAKRA